MWVTLAALLVDGMVWAGDAQPFSVAGSESDLVVVRWDPARLREVRDARRPFVARDFPLPSGRRVNLLLEPFFVTSPRSRFVVGRKNAEDRTLEFDPDSLAFFRGSIEGRSGSHVFLALSDRVTTGRVELGGGGGRFGISSMGPHGEALDDGLFSLFAFAGSAGLPPDVPLCAVEQESLPASPPPVASGTPPPVVGLRRLELALETDYEFFQLFGNAEDAAAYLVALYAAISDIYLRDVDTWVELTYLRLWEDPDDLFNVVEPTPIYDFRDHWNAYMGGVHRDVAQLVSGRRDYPFGGQGFISALCGDAAYSVVGYATGALPDPTRPSPYQYDMTVLAHELGHNAGTGHTQDEGIDTCHLPVGTPQRGTIMSYCGQTWSGGNANHDPYFHSLIQENIEAHVGGSACVDVDCNRNAVDDAADVLFGASVDENGNGVPDECEDCNGNLVLDDQDIASATSADLNGNGVPDECDPDCDADGIPDDKEIADGTSFDLYGNDVPDECETDCNSNGTSDYIEIQANMSLDVDRNAELDSCQNCDGDGLTDHEELAGGHNLWVASGLPASTLLEFFATTGVRVSQSSGGGAASVGEGQDLIVAPGGRVLVSSGADHRVMEFDLDGGYQGDLVAGSSGGLTHPTGLLMTNDGRLLVASRDTDSVLAYDGTTGAFLGAFVPAGSGGLAGPFGMTLGPDGRLYVTSSTDEVLAYDGQNGSFEEVFVDAAANGGLDQPRGLAFKPDGQLLVASYGSNEVLEYAAGTGAPLGKWAQVGTGSVLTQVSPWGIRVGPNGNVFVVRTGDGFGASVIGGLHDDHDDHDDDDSIGALHLSNAQIYEYDARNGNFIRTLVGGNDHGLAFPTGFDFIPGWEGDCNQNLFPDECDIASGVSDDADRSGVPDDCETDCDGNGRLDRLDIVPYGSSLDCNGNLAPDGCDVAFGASEDCDANGVPDECDPDCNGNDVPDECDIDAGLVTDCNANHIPDLCETTFDFEAEQGWTAGAAGDTADQGQWVRVNPVGSAAQTEFDRTPGAGRECYVTGQGAIGGDADANDVDGGTTSLLSPVLDLASDPDPEIGYWRWLSNGIGSNPDEDVLEVSVSNDSGQNWTTVEVVGPAGPETAGGWHFRMFRLSDFVTPTANVRLRFVAADEAGASTVEAAVDDVVIVPVCCQSAVACEDGLSCTIEICNQAAGQCSHEIAADSCLIGGSCFADGQHNFLDACLVCDPQFPGEWSPDTPAEIAGVAVGPSSATRIEWPDQGLGFSYDVAGGLLSDLAGDSGVDAASCLADGVRATFWLDPRPDPAAGDGYYYVVRSQNACGSGTYGAASAGAERLPTTDCP